MLKLEQLKKLMLTEAEYSRKAAEVLAKECLCVGLSNSASLTYRVPFLKKLTSVTVCPGPNIVYFNKVVTLQNMIDHIYGRTNVIDLPRPHMFVNELILYINYLGEQLAIPDAEPKRLSYCELFANNLLKGIDYYKAIVEQISSDPGFEAELIACEEKVKSLKDRVASSKEPGCPDKVCVMP
jgi:hypothetical protein